MPVSRGRKTKKKLNKHARKTKSQAPDEVYEGDGVRMERRGRMTYIQNTRTEEEHKAFLDSLPEGIENIDLRINAEKEKIMAVLSQYDLIGLLGGLNYNHLVKQGDPDDDGMAEVILEYALSLATALPPEQKPLPHGNDINRLVAALTELRQLAHARITVQSVLNRSKSQPGDDVLHELRFQTILEALSIRGSGYYVHVRQLFLELFSGHDTKLMEVYGFNSQDIVDTAEELEKAFSARLELPSGMPHPSVMQRFFDWAQRHHRLPFMNMTNLEAFGKDHPEFIIEAGRIVTYGINRIDDYEQLFRIRFTSERQEKVVRALAISFGDNAAFLQPPANADLLADSEIRNRPYTKAGEHYYLFSLPLLSRYYFSAGQYLLENADEKKAYYQKYFLNKQYAVSRDNFIERKVEELFRAFLPQVQFVPNVSYPLPDQKPGATNYENTELDLLGIGDQYTYLIEVKAGELNASGRRGAIDSLVSRLKKNVAEGDFQSRRAYNYIMNTEKPLFKKGKTAYEVDPEKPAFRIVVTLDPFAGLLVSTSVLENARIVSAEGGYPWIVNILDLMVFAEMLESENDFIDYLQQRLKLNDWKAFSTQDEVSLLGHFFSEDLQFGNRQKKLDHFTLNNHVQDFDEYYYAREFGLPALKPTRKRKKRR